MKGPLEIKSKEFALVVIRIFQQFQDKKREYVMSKQLLKAGTSIGANIREAMDGESGADFVHKMQIALKECSETLYWLELLCESGYWQDDGTIQMCEELKRMLVASIKTYKKKHGLL